MSTEGYRPRESYTSKDPLKRAKQLANLAKRRGKRATPLPTPFLSDPFNNDIRHFLARHYFIGKTLLGKRQAIKLEPFQVEILDALYPKDAPRPFDQAIIGLPRKQGKSTLCAGIALWHLFFDDVPSPEVYSLAADVEQAQIIFGLAVKAVRRNKQMNDLCKIYADRIEVPSRDAVYKVIPSDVASSYGLNPSAVFMDEFATASWDMWISLIGGMGARHALGQRPVAFMIGTAGFDLTSDFYKAYLDGLEGNDEAFYFYWSHEQVASFSDPAWIERMRRRMRPEQFQRFIENKWVAGSGAFLTNDDVGRCIDPDLGPTYGGKEGFQYVLACDLGLVKDRTVVTVVHPDDGNVVLDSIRVWQGSKHEEVMIADVEAYIVEMCNHYSVSSVVVDPWQMKGTVQRFRDQGLPVEEFTFHGANLAKLTANLYQLAHNGRLRIWNDPELVAELLSVQVVEKTYGQRIDHRPGMYSDRVISLGMACMVAVQDEGVSPILIAFMDDDDDGDDDAHNRRDWKTVGMIPGFPNDENDFF